MAKGNGVNGVAMTVVFCVMLIAAIAIGTAFGSTYNNNSRENFYGDHVGLFGYLPHFVSGQNIQYARNARSSGRTSR